MRKIFVQLIHNFILRFNVCGICTSELAGNVIQLMQLCFERRQNKEREKCKQSRNNFVFFFSFIDWLLDVNGSYDLLINVDPFPNNLSQCCYRTVDLRDSIIVIFTSKHSANSVANIFHSKSINEGINCWV